MKTVGLYVLLCTAALASADDVFDQINQDLTWSTDADNVRARVSGTLDLEGYVFQRPAPALLYDDGQSLFNPRLALFLDAQIGPRLYVFAQGRIDRGFDPSESPLGARLDEYAVRYSPWDSGTFNLQLGKFATVAGSWVRRHHSWDNPLITAPLAYEDLTGIFDSAPAPNAPVLLRWAGLATGHIDYDQNVPVIWGPSYATGAMASGVVGRVDYALEVKNASLSSRPDTWSHDGITPDHPTVTGRIGFRPDESWNLGVSASSGSYLKPGASVFVPRGRGLGDYKETLVAQDLSYAWHHLQLWAEAFEATFDIPGVGDPSLVSYYVEAKYRMTAQFAAALRWNQQLYGTIPDGAAGPVRWGRNAQRIDLAPSYRLSANAQIKLQVSLQENGGPGGGHSGLAATQLSVRF